jgi:hypothetical protein
VISLNAVTACNRATLLCLETLPSVSRKTTLSLSHLTLQLFSLCVLFHVYFPSIRTTLHQCQLKGTLLSL